MSTEAVTTPIRPIWKIFKVFKWLILSVGLLLAIYFYWQYLAYYPATDDAYIQANVIQIAPEVSGPVENVYVKNYDIVKKGAAILDINPEPFNYAVKKARAELDLTRQNIQIQQQAIETARALVAERQAELELVQKNYPRIMSLVKNGHASITEADLILSNLHRNQSALIAAKTRLLQAQAELGQGDDNNIHVRYARSQLAQATLNLMHTHITAPTDGYIVNLTARPGTMLREGVAAFALIDSNQWWVEANYKETQLKRIRLGQPAKVTVDIYPDQVFRGIVENISFGSGSVFSLFPAENATGNWVKVTQRFTVRVAIIDPPLHYPLRVGASAIVEINTNKAHD